MTNIFEILIIVGIVALQTFLGYRGNKYLGAILPVLFCGAVIFLFVRGYLSFSFKDMLMPLIGFLSLIAVYERANQSRKAKIKTEMEKMKAQDHIQH